MASPSIPKEPVKRIPVDVSSVHITDEEFFQLKNFYFGVAGLSALFERIQEEPFLDLHHRLEVMQFGADRAITALHDRFDEAAQEGGES